MTSRPSSGLPYDCGPKKSSNSKESSEDFPKNFLNNSGLLHTQNKGSFFVRIHTREFTRTSPKTWEDRSGSRKGGLSKGAFLRKADFSTGKWIAQCGSTGTWIAQTDSWEYILWPQIGVF